MIATCADVFNASAVDGADGICEAASVPGVARLLTTSAPAHRSRSGSRHRQFLQVPPVRPIDSLAEPDPGPPPQPRQLRDVEELARRSVRLRRVEHGFPFEADHVGHDLRELADGDVLTDADVDDLWALVLTHQEDAGIGEVVGVEELPSRGSRAPDLDAAPALPLGLVELPDEGGKDVAGL